MRTAGPGRRRFTFRAHLAAFALAVALPVTVLAAALITHVESVVRTQAEARLLQLAQALSDDIDRDVERHILVLNTLSTMPAFQNGDWPTFYVQAKAALRGDGYIVVADNTFHQLVNTYVPYGRAPRLTGDLETARLIAATRRPQVSNVFTSLVTGGAVINVDVPVMRNGELQYILMYGRPIEHLAAILDGEALEPGWTSLLYDRHGTLMARSSAVGAEALGSEPPPPAVSTNGLSRRNDAEGDTILRAVHSSASTGWTVTVDVPLAVVNSEISRSLRWWVYLATGMLLLAIAFGVLFGHFLSRQMRGAAAFATAMGREEPAPVLKPTLAEVSQIFDALQNARAELSLRMDQQRLLSRELNHRVKNVLGVVQAVVRRSLSDDRSAAESREIVMQRIHALARSQDLLTKSDWTDLPLKQIVEMEIAPFADRIRCEGPELLIDSKNVPNFGLLLHELTTNAVKYGALRDDSGTIDVVWRIEEGGAGRRFAFQWKERCAPAPAALGNAGFGATLLRGAFAGPDSTYRFEMEPDGVVYELAAPLSLVAGDSAGPGKAVGSETPPVPDRATDSAVGRAARSTRRRQRGRKEGLS